MAAQVRPARAADQSQAGMMLSDDARHKHLPWHSAARLARSYVCCMDVRTLVGSCLPLYTHMLTNTHARTNNTYICTYKHNSARSAALTTFLLFTWVINDLCRINVCNPRRKNTHPNISTGSSKKYTVPFYVSLNILTNTMVTQHNEMTCRWKSNAKATRKFIWQSSHMPILQQYLRTILYVSKYRNINIWK